MDNRQRGGGDGGFLKIVLYLFFCFLCGRCLGEEEGAKVGPFSPTHRFILFVHFFARPLVLGQGSY